jgi:hypothetical protein
MVVMPLFHGNGQKQLRVGKNVTWGTKGENAWF